MNPNEPILDDSTPLDTFFPGEGYGRGLVPRDYEVTPLRSVEFPLIPRSEWSARIKEMEETKSRISDIWNTGNAGEPIPHLVQGSIGYCWSHSATHAVIAARAVANLPYVPLSAFAVGATLMKGQDKGAWGALALQFITERGVPSQAYWPQGSLDLKYGTSECWENAKRHKVSESWVDVAAPVWNRDLSWDQVMTLLLSRVGVIADFNWWGHSVYLCDPVEVERGSYGVRLLNSWPNWGDRGFGVLRGSRAIPDNATAVRSVTAL